MTDNRGMTITEFLEARIAEDEARASSGWAHPGDSRWETDNYGRDFLTPSAVRAECASKRAIIEQWIDPASYGPFSDGVEVGIAEGIDTAVRALAAVYKDHPDYREEWA